jgi:hypothetical protein
MTRDHAYAINMEYLTIYLENDDKFLVIESDTPRVLYNSDKCVSVHYGPDRDYNGFILGRLGSRKEAAKVGYHFLADFCCLLKIFAVS